MIDFIYRWKFSIISLIAYMALRIVPIIVDSKLEAGFLLAGFLLFMIATLCEVVVNGFNAMTKEKVD